MSKFRDNSDSRAAVFETRNVKDYQETHHFQMGKEGVPMMTSTWTHFSKRHKRPQMNGLWSSDRNRDWFKYSSINILKFQKYKRGCT